jgi:DNA-binding NarL/FixJ family response regulator
VCPRVDAPRIAVLSPQDIVRTGIAVLLRDGDEQWEVSLGHDAERPADVVLYDVICLHGGDGAELLQLVDHDGVAVVAIGRDLRPDLQARALELGARAAVSLGVSGGELLGTVRTLLSGSTEQPRGGRATPLPRLGHEVGLSMRESAVLRLIALGYSNVEIAERLGLSINSIKTYIRTAYRKAGVSTRQQAVTWAVRHGFPIDRHTA